jgi:protein-S-isoprenylcysteine O-methyltransferase Ste14
MSQLVQFLSSPEAAIYVPWDIWLVTWIAAALWANRTLKRPEIGRELPYRAIAFSGFILLLVFHSQNSTDYLRGIPGANPLTARHWALPPGAGWALVGLVALGLIFAWWARIHLGRLWSARITRKEGHKVIDTGPYAFVRHPIYTGLIFAALATAAERGSALAVLGAVLFCAGYWMKARLEERFLRQELGADAYDRYATRTAMLVPFLF